MRFGCTHRLIRRKARTVCRAASVSLAVVACAVLAHAGRGTPAPPDPFEPIRPLAGDWVGAAEGEAGKGTVQRSYAFVIGDHYLHERNLSTYPSQEANPKGEVHEHWSLFSYDREREALVMRQFHQEGFVNQYVMNAAASGKDKVVFDSERFENFSNEWKARETYEIKSVDEFVETFELAAPGKQLEVYSRTHFKRFKGRHCGDNKRLAELTRGNEVLVLCAASSVIAGADSVCEATFEPGWQASEPGSLAEMTTPEKLAAGLDFVCASILSLPTGEDKAVRRRLEAWIAAYRYIDRLSADYYAEALATGVAYVPALADVLPDDIDQRAPNKENVGDNLASAEHTELHYSLADRISGMPDDAMSKTLMALSDQVRDAARGDPTQQVEVKQLRVGDVDLAYVEEGKGDTVVFVHGACGDWRTWDAVRPFFARKFHYVALSRRYHYPNPWPDDGRNYSVMQNVEDVAGFIRALNVGKVHLVGGSYGGRVAGYVALNYPELLRSVVLNEPGLIAPVSAEGKRARAEFIAEYDSLITVAKAGDERRAAILLYNAVQGDRDAFNQMPHSRQQRWLDNAKTLLLMDAGADPPPITCEQLSAIKVPVLVMRGENTRAVFRYGNERLLECLPKGTQSAVVPLAPHAWYSTNPIGARYIADFISAH